MVKTRVVNPRSLGKAVGYANGVEVSGAKQWLLVGGQIGARPGRDGIPRLVSKSFATQFQVALENVVEVVKAAGGGTASIVELTLFVKDMAVYRRNRKALAPIWRSVMGRYYPAITLVAVSDLFERGALVEIQARAALG